MANFFQLTLADEFSPNQFLEADIIYIDLDQVEAHTRYFKDITKIWTKSGTSHILWEKPECFEELIRDLVK